MDIVFINKRYFWERAKLFEIKVSLRETKKGMMAAALNKMDRSEKQKKE